MINVIRKRRSIREFLPKPIEEEKIEEILKAAMFSPSSKNRRPWQFILVKNKEAIEKLSHLHQYSDFIKSAPLLIAIGADENTDPRWIEDCSIAAGYIYLEATNQGLGTCWVQVRETKTADGQSGEDYVKKILEAPKNIRILCLMPIGYPAYHPPEHSESEFNPSKIHYEKF